MAPITSHMYCQTKGLKERELEQCSKDYKWIESDEQLVNACAKSPNIMSCYVREVPLAASRHMPSPRRISVNYNLLPPRCFPLDINHSGHPSNYLYASEDGDGNSSQKSKSSNWYTPLRLWYTPLRLEDLGEE